MDGRWQLGMAYFGQGKSHDAHFFCVEKERTQFCLSRRQRHKLENGVQRLKCSIYLDRFDVAGNPDQEKFPYSLLLELRSERYKASEWILNIVSKA